MVDAADGSTTEELEPTERREHWYKEIIDAIKAGGGSGGGNTEIVNFTITYDSENDSYGATCDHTLAQLDSARIAGKDIIPIINVPADVTQDGDVAYVAEWSYYDDGESESYAAYYDNIRPGLAGLTGRSGLIRTNIRCNLFSDDIPILVEFAMSVDVSVSAAFYVKETSNKLDKTYANISSALETGGKVVYVYNMFNMRKKVIGVILSASYDESAPRYDVYGIILSDGSFETVHWQASASTGELTRV